MSPILVRPVREQFEHDRIIRLLHGKRRPRHEAGMNPGAEHNVAVGTGPTAVYPDLVLHSLARGHRLEAVIEVETGESVNHLEALAEWAHYGRLRAAFHLYVPASMVDVARRLCEDNQISVAEVWSYHTVADDVRFTLIHRSPGAVSLDAAPSRPAAGSRSSSGKAPAAASAAAKVRKAGASGGSAKRTSASPAEAATAKRTTPKPTSAKRTAKRATVKRAQASRSAKAPAVRRKPAPTAKKAARPQKRK